MIRLLVTRLLAAIPLMFLVGTIVFFLQQLNPVDPTAAILGDDTSDAAVEAAREDLGLNRPVITQYTSWLGDAVRGDLGTSWFNGEEVTTLLVRRAKVTFSIVAGAMLVAVVIGVSLGVTAALKAGRWPDRLVTVVSSLGIAVPNFWVAIILAAVFAVNLGWFPALWSITRTASITGWIHTIILPCLALGTASSAAIARQTRSAMIGVLQQDYIRTALAKGLPVRRVIFRHALRNAAIPIVTLLGFQLSALIGGAIFVEFIFNIPGLGTIGVESVQRNNAPIILGFVMITTLVVVIANILLDMSYAWLNPRFGGLDPMTDFAADGAIGADGTISTGIELIESDVGKGAGGGAAPSGSRFWNRFRRNKLALFAGGFLLFELFLLAIAPLITSHDPNLATSFADFLKGPGTEYWWGTDSVGRDIYTRIIYGTRFAFTAGAVAVVTALAIGVPLGLTIGFFRGWVDRIVMRFVESIVAIPAVVLAISIIAVTGPGLVTAMFAIGLVYSMIITRLTRAEVFAAREELYVDGARAAGASDARIMFRHILPNIAPVLIVQTTLLFATSVLAEAALSFLGLGASTNQASWGRMLRSAQESIDQSIWPAFPPGIAIFVTVVAFNVLGDGLRDAFGREARGGRVGVGDVELASVSGTRAPKPDALLSVRDLSIRFPRPGTTDDVSVVRDVDFDIDRGQVMALVGESGSGKSITALSLLGLVPDPGRASASSISLDGRELVGLGFDELRSVRGKEIGLISQEPSAALNPAYTVGRQIAEPLIYHLGMSKSEARQRAIELMTRVGIPDPEVRIDSYPHQFSGGMAQRVVIAMALSCNPKLLIADEPTTALDVTVQGQVLDLIGELSRELGVSVLLITHDLGVVADLASDVAVMYAGEIVEAGKLVEVFHQPQHPYTEGLIKAIPRNEERSGQLPTIDGVVPPPWEWPDGCHFAPRCPYATDDCRSGDIELRPSAMSQVRCVRAADLDLIGVGQGELADAFGGETEQEGRG